MIDGALRVLLSQKGRPACRADDAGIRPWWVWFVIEYHGSLPLLENLARGGFCREHAAEACVVAGTQHSGTARHELGVLDLTLAELLPVAPRPARAGWIGRCDDLFTRWRWRWQVARLRPQGPCPVCRQCEGTIGLLARLLEQNLGLQEGRELYNTPVSQPRASRLTFTSTGSITAFAMSPGAPKNWRSVRPSNCFTALRLCRKRT